MDERDPPSVLRDGDDLVAEHGACARRGELLDVRAAEPAGEHPHELAGPVGLREVRERRLTVLPHDHGAHGRIVGATKGAEWPSSCTAVPLLWAKASRHPCWRVQKALEDMGVEYEIVKEPWPLRSRRKSVIEGTGASALPAIELEDGTWYREQSAEMERAIRSGRFGSPS